MTDPADDDARPLLNIGAGWVHPDEPWLNVDVDPQFGLPLADPLAPGGLPWPDGYFRGGVAHHVLMMIPRADLIPWLVEVRRVVDGPLRISVPDLLRAVEAYHEGDVAWFPIADEIERTLGGKLVTYITQGGQTRSVFTLSYLMGLCADAGFSSVTRAVYGVSERLPILAALDSRPSESLYVEAA